MRARQHDLDRAYTMLSNHIAWRKETGADTIMDSFRFDERDSFLTIYPQGYHKTDKMVSCPLFFVSAVIVVICCTCLDVIRCHYVVVVCTDSVCVRTACTCAAPLHPAPQGRPVYIQSMGSIDLKKIMEVTTEERMVKFRIQVLKQDCAGLLDDVL